MKRVQREEFVVQGISVRTSNRSEMDPQNGKITQLWQDFFAACHETAQAPQPAYGVYANYASDMYGEFDVVAGLPGDFPHAAKHEVTIPSGTYLCFAKHGPLPESVRVLWQEVWDFFMLDNEPVRSYRADFEEYTGGDSVAIFIGIKEDI